jgi:hypothetical protein
MTKTGTVNRLKQHVGQPRLQMHPHVADLLEVKDSETGCV